MNFDILVPITFLIVFFGVITMALKHRERRRRELHQTLRSAMQSGNEVQHHVLERLALSVDPRRSDLRMAIIFAVMAMIVVILSQLLPFQDPVGRRALLSVAIIPGALALTYFAFWGFWYRKADASGRE